MTDRPIIMAASSVRGILAGTKTMTRRVLKPQPRHADARYTGVHFASDEPNSWFFNSSRGPQKIPERFAEGDTLWVRETIHRDPDLWKYQADGAEIGWPARRELAGLKSDVMTSMRMPKIASRLTLVVTEVKVERVQDISGEDTIAKGVECDTCRAMWTSACYRKGCFASRLEFSRHWNSLNGRRAGGAYSWEANPFVAAVRFETHRQNIDRMQP